MKKLFLCSVSIFFGFSGFGVSDVVLSNSNSNAIVRSEVSEEIVRSENNNEENRLTVNYRELSNPRVSENRIVIDVQDYSGDVAVGKTYEVNYPIRSLLLRYEHDFDKQISYPVEELSALVNDIESSNLEGKIIANSEFINKDAGIHHQLRIDSSQGTNGYLMKDEDLHAIPYMETYISTEAEDLVIAEAKLHPESMVEYEKVNGSIRTVNSGKLESRPDDKDFDYQPIETLEDWKRPDGTIFTNVKRDFKKIAKPPLPKAVPPQPQHVVNQAPPSGGNGNFFHRAFGW